MTIKYCFFNPVVGGLGNFLLFTHQMKIYIAYAQNDFANYIVINSFNNHLDL